MIGLIAKEKAKAAARVAPDGGGEIRGSADVRSGSTVSVRSTSTPADLESCLRAVPFSGRVGPVADANCNGESYDGFHVG